MVTPGRWPHARHQPSDVDTCGKARHQPSDVDTCGRARHQRDTAGVQRYRWYRPQTAGVRADHHRHPAARWTRAAGLTVTQSGAAATPTERLDTSDVPPIPVEGSTPAFRRRYLWKGWLPAVYSWCPAILLVSATNRWCPRRPSPPPGSSMDDRGRPCSHPARRRRDTCGRARHQPSDVDTCGKARHQRYTAGVQRYRWYRPPIAGVCAHQQHHPAARWTRAAGLTVTQSGAAAGARETPEAIHEWSIRIA
ncbi:hypothetical protein SAMN02745244_00268 [Tessaracoccus bendigoensis DSM 12906]|uniref:Uncharacterized protein n=1 Tax=Tessaracoccus bendigoensis DSM 12906 TaxID=1123357 RepID=A0A1M6ATV9_9ACTN|nr:hypothetical protein SAMN02745244_00268 [Tessaracoccus bendigoensis DSM 12906]